MHHFYANRKKRQRMIQTLTLERKKGRGIYLVLRNHHRRRAGQIRDAIRRGAAQRQVAARRRDAKARARGVSRVRAPSTARSTAARSPSGEGAMAAPPPPPPASHARAATSSGHHRPPPLRASLCERCGPTGEERTKSRTRARRPWWLSGRVERHSSKRPPAVPLESTETERRERAK